MCRLDAGAHLVTAPAARMDGNLGAEPLIGDGNGSSVVTVGTGLSNLHHVSVAVAGLALDPEIVEEPIMRCDEGGSVDLNSVYPDGDGRITPRF